MKKIILAIVVIGVIGVAAYYVSASGTAAPETATTKTADKPPAAMAAPVAVPVKPTTPATKSQPTPAVAGTKQVGQTRAPGSQAAKPAESKLNTAVIGAEITTTLAELGRLMGTADYETLMSDFMPPEELDALLTSAGRPGQPLTLSDLANRMRQSPQVQQKMAGAAQFMSFLQTQIPIIGETGETASFPMQQTINGKNSLDLVKVNGKWYVKDGAQFFK